MHQDNTPKYSKLAPIFISPHTSTTIDLFLSAPYNRCAWVIPVRGILPWSHCSEADVSSEILVARGPGNTDEILWNTETLRQFWSFLNSLRKARTFGSVALSFHCGPTNQGVPTSTSDSTRPLTSSDGPVRHVDHFKIYHDAPVAMSLRTILDSWYWEPAKDDTSANTSRSRRNRVYVLRDARLVLLDEASRGILIL